MNRKCTTCKLVKDEGQFHKKPSGELRTQCNKCISNRRRITYKKKKDGYIPKYVKSKITCDPALSPKNKVKAYQKAYRALYKNKLTEQKRVYADAIKFEGISHYGGKCACCGETEVKFLTIEHKEGRAKTEKRRTGKRNWMQLKRDGWPTNIELLCFNCNCAKGAFGVCPHKLR